MMSKIGDNGSTAYRPQTTDDRDAEWNSMERTSDPRDLSQTPTNNRKLLIMGILLSCSQYFFLPIYAFSVWFVIISISKYLFVFLGFKLKNLKDCCFLGKNCVLKNCQISLEEQKGCGQK